MPTSKQRRRQRKSKSRPKQDLGWFTIKGITDEKIVKGKPLYEIEWEGLDDAGNPYERTWESEVTDVARQEWEAAKARAAQPQPSSSAQELLPSPIPSQDDAHNNTQESQPPRPANWRQIERAVSGGLTRARSDDDDDDDDDDAPPPKRIRPDYHKTPSEEPLPSFTSGSSPGSLVDYSYHSRPGTGLGQVAVELYRPVDFDPAGFHSVPNTQTSAHSSQSLAELEEVDKRLVFGSQSSPKTILDSQEPSGQTLSSYYSAAQTPAQRRRIVIPDSQEASHSIEGTWTESGSKHDSFVPPGLDDSGHSSGEAIADSQPAESAQPAREIGFNSQVDHSNPSVRETTVDSHPVEAEIPSRQPDPNYETQQISTDNSKVDSGSNSSPQHPRRPLPQSRPAQSPQPESSPAFFSQPFYQYLQNLGKSQSVGSPRESQAAQVLHRGNASGQTFSTSHISESSSVSTRHPEPSKHQSRSASLSGVDKTSSQVAEERRSDSHLTTPQHRTMEKRVSESATSSTDRNSLSVADALKQIVEETFSDPPPSNSRTLSAEAPATHYEAASETPQGQASTVAPGIASQPLSQTDLSVPEPTFASQQLPETNTPKRSAMEEIQDIVDATWGPDNLTPQPPTGNSPDMQHATVSPADITKQADADKMPLSLLSSLTPRQDFSSTMFRDPEASMSMGHVPGDLISEGSPIPEQVSTSTEHLVTLPFQASMRSLYESTLLESRTDIVEFGSVFSNELYTPPDEQLVQRIDRLLGRLNNICDYPQDLVGTVLEELPPNEQARYSCDANPKLSFIYELLDGLETGSEILIIARSVELLRLLYNITTVLGVNCSAEAIGKSGNANSAISVTLALPDQDVDVSTYTIAVGFDHAFNGSALAQKLSARSPAANPPLVLVLVTTHSVEHIDLHVPADLSPLERMNALLSGIINVRKLVSDPPRGYLEPDRIAVVFSDYLNGRTDTIEWEPVPMPEEVLDIYFSSQPQTQLPLGAAPDQEPSRKRKLDESDEEDAKRMRIIPLEKSTVVSNEPPLTDAVRKLLESVSPASSAGLARESTTKVPLTTLEALAEKVTELERQAAAADIEPISKNIIKGLEKRVKEYERTNERIYQSHRRAIEDRAKFEAETRQFEVLLESAQTSARKDNEKSRSRIAELEAMVARLQGGPDQPGQEQPVAGPEAQLKEAQDKIQAFEKRLENARQEADYARAMYQDASSAASSVGAENSELKQHNKELQQKASDNLVIIHQTQAENNAKQQLRRINDLKAQVRDREVELDRARDELRQLKNGRRETRQASVPRSPRMGMMSPRTGRTIGGSASRGTSPAPAVTLEAAAAATASGMQFMAPQTGNGRWNHLRE